MIKVRFRVADYWITRQYNDDVQLRVLSAGTLKVVQPVVTEIPPMGTDGTEPKPIIKEPERTLAVFNGTYFVEET